MEKQWIYICRRGVKELAKRHSPRLHIKRGLRRVFKRKEIAKLA